MYRIAAGSNGERRTSNPVQIRNEVKAAHHRHEPFQGRYRRSRRLGDEPVHESGLHRAEVDAVRDRVTQEGSQALLAYFPHPGTLILQSVPDASRAGKST